MGNSLRTIAPGRPSRTGMMRFLPATCERTGCLTSYPTAQNVSFYTTTFASRLPGGVQNSSCTASINLNRLQDSNMTRREASPIKHTIRRDQLREMLPLADSTLYEMEQRGEVPRRFAISARCVVWDLALLHL